MTLMSVLLSSSVTPPAEDLGRLLVWVAVPAAVLGAAAAALIKRAILSQSTVSDRGAPRSDLRLDRDRRHGGLGPFCGRRCSWSGSRAWRANAACG